MLDIVVFLKFEKFKEVIVGKKVDDKVVFFVEYKCIVSIFFEVEIMERKRVWNKIVMLLDL